MQNDNNERLIKKVEDSRTEQVHLIMRQHLNSSGRLFGGILMQWIDEVAGVVAMRHAGTSRVTTAAIDNLQFKEPTYEGELLVLIGYITCVGKSSMEVEIDTYVERSDGMRYSVNRAFFVMVAMDEQENPMQVPDLAVTSESEKARCQAGKLRKSMRLNRSKTGF
ncbi:MAG: acyl-CoA thioesterase [Eubacteriales bacterium]|nr:acyl-CoA thioesterase [Eubacteriales bacterium]